MTLNINGAPMLKIVPQYTGTSALGMLVGLVIFSLPCIRRRTYEAFYYVHFGIAISYLGLCFWHFGKEGDSWNYLWATVAVWLFSVLGRVFYKNQALRFDNSWLAGSPTQLTALPGDMTLIDVLVPCTFAWRPGQHCYIRIPSVSMLDNHPFTIVARPRSFNKKNDLTLQDEKSAQVLSFFARTHSGFTQKISLHRHQSMDLTLHSWIEGPYGGHTRRIENHYDTFIFVAGGAGITLCLTWMLYLGEKLKAQSITTTQVKLVWAVREEKHLDWISDELKQLAPVAPPASITMDFFITDQAEGLLGGSERLSCSLNPGKERLADSGKKVDEIRAHELTTSCLHRGRPDLTQLLPSLIPAGKTVVISCGPRSLQVDVSNAIASAQSLVLKGLANEIMLQTERFDW